MKWLPYALFVVALLLADALFLYRFASAKGSAAHQERSDGSAANAEELSAKNAYLKRRNAILREKLARQRKTFLEYTRQLGKLRASTAYGQGTAELEALPFVGVPFLIEERLRRLEAECAELELLAETERSILGYANAEIPSSCRLPPRERRREAEERVLGSIRDYLEAGGEGSEETRNYLRERVHAALESAARWNGESRGRLLALYDALLEENLSKELKEATRSAVEYWRFAYGLAESP